MEQCRSSLDCVELQTDLGKFEENPIYRQVKINVNICLIIYEKSAELKKETLSFYFQNLFTASIK